MIVQDEILDLVSQDDTVIGQEKRSVIHAQNWSNFRVINGFICNTDKKLWVPRRTAKKTLFPLCLDASVGGHVSTGETYDQAFERESLEELGIDVSEYIFKKVARLTPHEHGTSAFMWIYLIESNSVPPYNQNDFIDFYWLTPEEVLHKIASGDKAKSDLPIMIKELKNKL